ncbi:MAG: Peptidase prepilin type [Modestobacter sp.]|nr:Peptidase prepilin type [Modestobacter sp.]
MTSALVLTGAGLGLVLGPWLATITVRLAERDPTARPTLLRVALTSVLAAAAVAAAPALTGDRPATLALAWFGAAAVVLAGVDLARHRLPDRVIHPAAAVCAAALLVDAAVTGAWGALVRAVAAAVVAFALATGARLVSPAGLGGGDVKLMGLLGLVLGWAGWGVLMSGVFVGFLVGALGSLLLMAVGRAGWRTRVAFGPPLLVGAYLSLWLAAPLSLP